MSPEGVIGLAGRLPWHYSADLKRFKRRTLGSTIIMGRRTWESIGCKALPGRRNVVVTSKRCEGVESFASVAAALASSPGDVWFIGGAQLYAEAIDYCQVLDVTYVPDRIDCAEATRFPDIDWAQWEPGPLTPFEDDPRLTYRVFHRRGAHAAAGE